MDKRLTIGEFSALLAVRAGLDAAEAEAFVKGFFEEVAENLARGERVDVDYVGTFSRAEFDTVNPVRFLPASGIADLLNEPFSMFEVVEIDDDAILPENDEPELVEDEEAVEEIEIVEDRCPTGWADQTSPTGQVDPISSVDEPASPRPSAEAPQAASALEPTPSHAAEDEASVVVAHDDAHEARRSRSCCKALCAVIVVLLMGLSYLVGFFTPEIIVFIRSCGHKAGNLITAPVDQPGQCVADTPAVQPEQPVVVTVRDTVTVSVAAPVAPPEPEVTTDTVRKRYYITTMAKKYYGDDNFWPYIYLENQDKLGHPDYTAPGTVVVIPPAAKYGIDVNDPASLSAAKQKGYEIYRRFDKKKRKQ